MSPRGSRWNDWAGTGGSARSALLIDAGIPIMGFDVDPARCNAFRDIGVKPAPIAQMPKDVELILGEGKRYDQMLPMILVQADLLRKTIERLGGECGSAAIIAAIHPSANTGASS